MPNYFWWVLTPRPLCLFIKVLKKKNLKGYWIIVCLFYPDWANIFKNSLLNREYYLEMCPARSVQCLVEYLYDVDTDWGRETIIKNPFDNIIVYHTIKIYNWSNTMFHTAPSWMNNIIQLSPKENVNFKPTEKEKRKPCLRRLF